MGFGLTSLLAIKAGVLFLFFAYLNTLEIKLLSLPVLYASIISAFVSIASHPRINLPMVLGKNPDGSFPMWSIVLFSPYLYFVRIFSYLRRWMSGEEPYTMVCEGVYVGGWPNSLEKCPPGNPAIIDCTCEFPRKMKMKRQPYLCIPTWDTRSPKPGDIKSAVIWALKKKSRYLPIFIHCAYGHGRSVAVACAIMVALQVAEDWQTAEKLIKEKRPRISMNTLHRGALKEWAKQQ